MSIARESRIIQFQFVFLPFLSQPYPSPSNSYLSIVKFENKHILNPPQIGCITWNIEGVKASRRKFYLSSLTYTHWIIDCEHRWAFDKIPL